MKLAKIFTALSLVVVFLFIAAFSSALAARALFSPEKLMHAPAVAMQEPAPVNPLDDLLATLKNLGGFALLVTAVINASKQFGWITDGSAQKFSLLLNGAGLLGLIYLQFSGGFDLVPVLDKQAGAFAYALNAVLALVFQLYVSRKGHDTVLAGMPFFGKSFSGRKAGENTMLQLFEG